MGAGRRAAHHEGVFRGSVSTPPPPVPHTRLLLAVPPLLADIVRDALAAEPGVEVMPAGPADPDLLAERWADNPHFVHADAARPESSRAAEDRVPSRVRRPTRDRDDPNRTSWYRIAAGGTMVLVPDPVVCFAGARYRQDQHVAGAVMQHTLRRVTEHELGKPAAGERAHDDDIGLASLRSGVIALQGVLIGSALGAGIGLTIVTERLDGSDRRRVAGPRARLFVEPRLLQGRLVGGEVRPEPVGAHVARDDADPGPQAGGYSFPSSHATSSMAVYGTLAYLGLTSRLRAPVRAAGAIAGSTQPLTRCRDSATGTSSRRSRAAATVHRCAARRLVRAAFAARRPSRSRSVSRGRAPAARRGDAAGT